MQSRLRSSTGLIYARGLGRCARKIGSALPTLQLNEVPARPAHRATDSPASRSKPSACSSSATTCTQATAAVTVGRRQRRLQCLGVALAAN